MERSTFISHPKKLSLLLNTTFLFLFSFYITTNIPHQHTAATTTTTTTTTTSTISTVQGGNCTALHDFSDDKAKCAYVTLQSSCKSKGYINYVQVFYCNCGDLPLLGYTILLLSLVLLFYLLGNTASNYFCPSLESLSRTLNLSPIIAGTTLLPLGNGATDVFSGIVSFTRSGDGDVGLNSILGGAFFISSIVVGVISILITSHHITVDKPSFIRDVLFLLFSLLLLLLIIIFGRINLWVAICFTSVYFVYICLVCGMHFHYKKEENLSEMGRPLLGCVDEGKANLVEKRSDCEDQLDQKERKKGLFNIDSTSCVYLGWLVYALDLPLYLPRRVTIPVVSEERWSKAFAVISVTLAPILLATLWNTQKEGMGSKARLEIYMTSGLIGLILGNFAFVGTKMSNPPKTFLFPWLLGGFVMSITWTYIIAEELVSLLVALGIILGISPSVLGLTVLAWGNSIGDLIANSALAINGGPDGAQIAISGCYAGPLFNTLMGLGLSLVFVSWSEYPSSYVIPRDPYLYETIGFLMSGLLWALVVLPRRNMQVDRFLGGGLLAIYLCFLFLRLAMASGVLKLHASYYFIH